MLANEPAPIGFSNVVTISVGDVATSAPSAGVDSTIELSACATDGPNSDERAARAEEHGQRAAAAGDRKHGF